MPSYHYRTPGGTGASRGGSSRGSGSPASRHRSRISARAWVLLTVLMVLAAGVWGGYQIIVRQPFDTSLQVKTLPVTTEWRPFGQLMLSLQGQTLSYLDDQGVALWSPTLPFSGTLAVGNYDLIGVYNENMSVILDAEGQTLCRLDYPQGIKAMRMGEHMAALQSADEQGAVIAVYNSDASAVETLRFEKRVILDFGFYQGDQLWVLLLDHNADLPGCRINTYNPGVSLTGVIAVPGQLVYRVLVTPLKEVVAIGTESVICYNAIGTRKEEVSLTGWTLRDAWVNGSDIHLVLSQQAYVPAAEPSLTPTPEPMQTPPPASVSEGAPLVPIDNTLQSAEQTPSQTNGEGTENKDQFTVVRSMKLASRTSKSNNTETYFDVTSTVISLPTACTQVIGSTNGQRLYALSEGSLKVLRNGKLEQELVLDNVGSMSVTADRRLLYVPSSANIARIALPK